MELQKQLPYDLNLESAILGSMLDSGYKSTKIVIANTSEDDFYLVGNRVIYLAIKGLFEKNEPIDVISVANALKTKGNLESAGGMITLVEYTEKVTGTENLDYYSRILKQFSLKRKMYDIGHTLKSESLDADSDCFILSAKYINELSSLTKGLLKVNERGVSDYIRETMKLLGKKTNDKIYTGLHGIDQFVKVRKGKKQMIFVTGMPSSGKTVVSVDWAVRLAKQGIPVGIFSLEMATEQLVDRLIVGECGGVFTNHTYDIESLDTNGINLVQGAMSKVSELPLYITDNIRTVEDMVYIMSDWKEKHGISIVVIDYLQKIPLTKSTNTESHSHNSSVLAQASKDLGLPMIIISSQTNESQKAGQGKAYSGLKGSGDIMYDADNIIEIINPIQHSIDYWDFITTIGRDVEAKNTLKLEFKKARNGALGSTLLTADLPTNRLSTYGVPIETKNLIAEKPSHNLPSGADLFF
jgi:replicative DNA helicase